MATTKSPAGKRKSQFVYAFDLDDTIIDNAMVDYESFVLTAQQFKQTVPSQQTILNWRRQGLLAQDIIKRIFTGKTERTVAAAVAWRKTILHDERVLRHSVLRQGSRGALFSAWSAGTPTFIISRKPKSIIRQTLKRHGIAKYFTGIFSARNKQLVLRALYKKFRTEVIFVTDMVDELKAAQKETGISVFAMRSAYQDLSALQTNSVNIPCIATLQEIPGLEQMPRALVTGAAGFIGSALTSQLSHDGFAVTGLYHEREPSLKLQNVSYYQCDIQSRESILSIPGTFEVLFHTAAYLGDDVQRCLSVNVTGTQNLLAFCKERNIPRFIFSSSSSVYGKPQSLPVKESAARKPLSVYGHSKLLAEQTIAQATNKTKLIATVFRYGSPYGPGQAAHSVLPIFVQRARANTPLVLYGTGKRTQEFIYVTDIARANVYALQSTKTQTFNAGSGESISMRQLAEQISKTFSQNPQKPVPVQNSSQKETSFNLRLDSAKILRELDFKATTTVAEGLARMRAAMK